MEISDFAVCVAEISWVIACLDSLCSVSAQSFSCDVGAWVPPAEAPQAAATPWGPRPGVPPNSHPVCTPVLLGAGAAPGEALLSVAVFSLPLMGVILVSQDECG